MFRQPAVIVRAVRLLCVYAGAKVLLMGLKLISQVMDGSWAEWSDRLKHDSPALEHLMTFDALAVFAMTIGFYGLAIWKIHRGRNWARYLLLTAFVLTCVYDIAARIIGAKALGWVGLPWATVVWALLMAMYCYAVYLLFTKQSSAWFAAAVSQKQEA
jgi:hypothetical protein